MTWATAKSEVPTTTVEPRVASLDEMLATLDLQPHFRFFELPGELRRNIYLQIWRSYLEPCNLGSWSAGSILRLHIHTPNWKTTRLTHTPCARQPGEPETSDPNDFHC
ncbi:hypothetical protein C8A01DRAFT_35300 [Parachaetomium inaequale]|uniref:Uncharacterized protein n=1 Tax=Parachaetomium inaequale TaxID=2588326 RepID=A0AAN6PHB6_9PEZI|nr:hypothetical protein C8A01DRAFT_35300 [Parachaetomium inaequale]